MTKVPFYVDFIFLKSASAVRADFREGGSRYKPPKRGHPASILTHPFEIEVLGKTKFPGCGAKSEYYSHSCFILFFLT